MTDVIHRIPSKGIKASIAVDMAQFPVHIVPELGLPGGKKLLFTFELTTEDGQIVRATVNGSQLGRQRPAVDAAATGFFVFTGRLLPNGELADAGVLFNAKQAKAQEQEAA